MRRIATSALVVVALLALLVSATGCTRVKLADDPATKTFTESSSLPLQGATTLTAEIEQGIGELTVRGSSETTDAVKAVFTFAPESWRPEASSTVEASAATLHITQPQDPENLPFDDLHNAWDITLPGGIPTDLGLKLGLGKSDIDLRGVDLSGLTVFTGIGETHIDLSGERTADLHATIECGVGELTLKLPRNVGVRISGNKDGVGSVSAGGLTSRDGVWTNAAYAGTGPKMEIELNQGIGDIKFVLVD
jgi:hypothetical protein